MAYKLITDSACDVSRETLAGWGVELLNMCYRFTDDDVEHFDDMDIVDFYNAMKSGRVAKTAAINSETFRVTFEEYLKAGTDVLYLAFSSGLSSTCSSAFMTAKELNEKYPNKVVVVDTLCASSGQGLLVYLASKKVAEGASIDEVAEYVESIRPNLSHWFTVDDLVYLKRGGRVSAASAFFGNLLGIKPVLHVDDEGHLIAMQKVRGRRTALNAIIDKFGETALDPKNSVIFISHAQCQADVDYVCAEVEKRYGAKVELVSDIGPVIGSHAGPGTLAFFFLGKER